MWNGKQFVTKNLKAVVDGCIGRGPLCDFFILEELKESTSTEVEFISCKS